MLDRILASSQEEPIHFKYFGEELQTIRNDKVIPTYGAKKPEKLIELVFQSSLKKESLYAVTGFGNGKHVRHLLKNTKGGTYILVAEKDPALLVKLFPVLIVQIFWRMTGSCLVRVNATNYFLKIFKPQRC